MNVYIGSDHAGFELKEYIFTQLKEIYNGDINDMGCYTTDSCDYPEIAHLVSKQVKNDQGLGILICGAAQGMAMTANKHKCVRACVAWNPEISKLSKQHNNANVLCLPARFIDNETALSCVTTFLKTICSSEPRHIRRINKII